MSGVAVVAVEGVSNAVPIPGKAPPPSGSGIHNEKIKFPASIATAATLMTLSTLNFGVFVGKRRQFITFKTDQINALIA